MRTDNKETSETGLLPLSPKKYSIGTHMQVGRAATRISFQVELWFGLVWFGCRRETLTFLHDGRRIYRSAQGA